MATLRSVRSHQSPAVERRHATMPGTWRSQLKSLEFPGLKSYAIRMCFQVWYNPAKKNIFLQYFTVNSIKTLLRLSLNSAKLQIGRVICFSHPGNIKVFSAGHHKRAFQRSMMCFQLHKTPIRQPLLPYSISFPQHFWRHRWRRCSRLSDEKHLRLGRLGRSTDPRPTHGSDTKA